MNTKKNEKYSIDNKTKEVIILSIAENSKEINSIKEFNAKKIFVEKLLNDCLYKLNKVEETEILTYENVLKKKYLPDIETIFLSANNLETVDKLCKYGVYNFRYNSHNERIIKTTSVLENLDENQKLKLRKELSPSEYNEENIFTDKNIIEVLDSFPNATEKQKIKFINRIQCLKASIKIRDTDLYAFAPKWNKTKPDKKMAAQTIIKYRNLLKKVNNLKVLIGKYPTIKNRS
ncbi:MAG: hypothetical protein IPH62_16360 [Ignavibacteriae bacterium]|nr:hypothetical protein [Ignavibacteriota bacterium]